MEKKGMTGQLLLEMILIIVLLIVIVSLIWRGVSRPGMQLTACESYGGKCYDVPCMGLHGDLQATPQSCDGNEGKPYCCIDVEAVIYKENTSTTSPPGAEPAEPSSPSDGAPVCNPADYPIYYANTRYVCIENNHARACLVSTDKVLGTIDTCTLSDKSHPAYTACCST